MCSSDLAGFDYRQLTDAFNASARASHRALWWESAGNLLSGVFTQIIIVAMIVLTAALSLSGALEPLPAIATIGICLRFTTMLEDIGALSLGMEERRQMMNHLDTVMDAELLCSCTIVCICSKSDQNASGLAYIVA